MGVLTMAQQTANGVLLNEGTEASLAAMIAGVPLAGAKLHLYKSGFSPTPGSVAADFAAQECDYTGYAAVAMTYSAIGVDSGGNPTVLSNRAFFQATDAVAPNVVGGCWVEHPVTGPPVTSTAIEFYPFSPQLNLTTPGAFIGVVIAFQIPAGPGYAIVDN